MNVTDNESYSPSAGKPMKVLRHWETNYANLIKVKDFSPLTKEDLMLAHDPKYVNDVFDLKINNGFGNKLKQVAESLLYTSGSLYGAAVEALKFGGVTCSPTSGFHHAGYDEAYGFCTFNGLVITARKLVEEAGLAKTVTIIDCDQHPGDGTRSIVEKLKLSYVKMWSFGEYLVSGDYKGEDQFLKDLYSQMMAVDSDLIIYQAGADPHVNDPLGGMLSTETMRKRDEIVFTVAKEKGIPVVWNFAGRYQNMDVLFELHSNTLLEAQKTVKDNKTYLLSCDNNTD
jgi:acetoin utilization deacetylase AcuC-like enzyme